MGKELFFLRQQPQVIIIIEKIITQGMEMMGIKTLIFVIKVATKMDSGNQISEISIQKLIKLKLPPDIIVAAIIMLEMQKFTLEKRFVELCLQHSSPLRHIKSCVPL